MNDKTKNILIIILSTLLVLSLSIIGYLIINKINSQKEITGTVIITDKDYVIIESDGEDYLINDIDESYEVGDKVKFTYKEKNLNEDNSPKSVKAEKESLIEKASKKEESTNNQPSEHPTTPSTNTNTNQNTTKPSTNQSTPNTSTTKNPDDEVLSYFNTLDTEFKASTIKDSLKNGFITVVDFIFYNGTIKGHTFKDLSDSAKLKVLSMALYFDSKIDTYFPGYKKSISSTTGKIYASAKNEIVSTYLNVASKVCENNEDLCTTAKEGFATIKKNFGLTWVLIKDIASDGLASLKNWYEIFSGK